MHSIIAFKVLLFSCMKNINIFFYPCQVFLRWFFDQFFGIQAQCKRCPCLPNNNPWQCHRERKQRDLGWGRRPAPL